MPHVYIMCFSIACCSLSSNMKYVAHTSFFSELIWFCCTDLWQKYCLSCVVAAYNSKCSGKIVERQHWCLAAGIIVRGSLSRLEWCNPGLTMVLHSSRKKNKNGSDKKYNKRNCLSYSISYHKVSVIKYLKHFHIQLLYSIQLLYLLFSSSIFCVYYVEIEQNINFTHNFVAGMMVIHQGMMVKPCCCFSLEKSHFV